MKSISNLILTFSVILSVLNAKAQFGGGTGTYFDPYWISTPTHLNNIRNYEVDDEDTTWLYLNSAFILVSNIDLGVAPWNEDEGWEPIGTLAHPFAGYFDGNDRNIVNLTINRGSESYIGLFGVADAADFYDVNFTNVSITGANNVGSLAGFIRNYTTINEFDENMTVCSVSGNISGNNHVGGFIGRSDGCLIKQCSFTSTVNGFDYVGGLVGRLDESNLSYCFTTSVTVEGSNDYVGGMIGRAYESTISMCYAKNVDVSMTGSGSIAGGLVGYLYSNVTIDNCYCSGSVAGVAHIGGLTGYSLECDVINCYSLCTVTGDGPYREGLIGRRTGGTITNSYWDTDVSGIPGPGNGDWRTTDEMTYAYAENTFVGWNFETVWVADPDIGYGQWNAGYPYLEWEHNPQQYGFGGGTGTEGDPYLIGHPNHLNSVRGHLSSYFLQIADLDLGEAPWNVGNGWIPIANFGGHYDGDHHTISNLTINNTDEDIYYLGLFGNCQDAFVYNLNLTNISIEGGIWETVGGTIGYADNTSISDCTIDGTLQGGSIVGTTFYGGLAGYCINGSEIIRCESDVDVSTPYFAGGLVGRLSGSNISYSNSGGNIEADFDYAGGLVGYAHDASQIQFCYSEGIISGGNNFVGGCIGIQSGSSADFCYSAANVSGSGNVGGFSGYILSGSTISNSYSRGTVTGGGAGYEGGFIGYFPGGIVWNCYSTGLVNTMSPGRGFIGVGGGTVTDCFWDMETSGQAASIGGGTGKTTDEMKFLTTFTFDDSPGLTTPWDFVCNPYDDAGTENYWDMDGVFNNGYPFLGFQKPRIQWNGTTNSSPEVPGNWSTGTAPVSTDNILISALAIHNMVIDKGCEIPAVYNSMFIEDGATIEIPAAKALTISNLVHNEGTINIQSGPTGTGSLLHGTADVPANIGRYLTGGWETWDAGWHCISSPVTQQNMAYFETIGEGNDYDLFGWDETTNTWMNYKAADFKTWNDGSFFNVGIGYLVSYEQTQTGISYSGKISVSNITLNNLSHTPEQGRGWHLLGNPFACALAWNDGNWALTNVAGVAKIWYETGKSYSDVIAGGIIPSAQGFMVQVSESTNSLIIPANSRLHNNHYWYKNGDEQKIRLIAAESDGSSFQECNILINPNATPGFDFDYDSRFLPGYAPQFYSVVNDEHLSTNCLNELSDNSIIPLGFEKNQAGSFVISLDENTTEQTIYLEDRLLNKTVNLSQNPVYGFTSTQGDNPDRFFLKSGQVEINETELENPLKIICCGNSIMILNQLETNSQLFVYNLTGQLVITDQLNSKTSISYHPDLPSGWYVIKIINERNSFSEKFFINR